MRKFFLIKKVALSTDVKYIPSWNGISLQFVVSVERMSFMITNRMCVFDIVETLLRLLVINLFDAVVTAEGSSKDMPISAVSCHNTSLNKHRKQFHFWGQAIRSKIQISHYYYRLQRLKVISRVNIGVFNSRERCVPFKRIDYGITSTISMFTIFNKHK